MNPSVETSFDLRGAGGLPLGSYLRALRYSPAGSRIAVARKLFPYLFQRVARSTAEICEFDSPGNYETSYRRLARLLGHSEKVPPPGEIDFLRLIQNRGAHPGTIGLHEFLFLTAFASILAPERAIEIGTLAGFSAAVIAAAIRRQHPDQRGTLVDTIDRNTHSVVSGIVRELARRDELHFSFIDADHRHPRPLLDLVRLTPYVRSGGWILFHDIQWGTMGRKTVEAGQTLRWGASYGAEWLFDYWPFRKISGGNIGAIQMPDEKRALIPFALRLMGLQFEITGKDARGTPLALYQSLFELL